MPRILRRPTGPLPLPDPPLHGDRVRLGHFAESDVAAIADSCDAEAARWLPLPDPYTEADARDFLASVHEAAMVGSSVEMALRAPSDDAYLGAIGLHLGRCRVGEGEIGYLVTPAARNRGVARQAVALLVPWAFSTFALRRIEILVRPGNEASSRVALGAGAASEGLRRNGLGFRTGEVADALVFAFVSRDIDRRRASAPG